MRSYNPQRSTWRHKTAWSYPTADADSLLFFIQSVNTSLWCEWRNAYRAQSSVAAFRDTYMPSKMWEFFGHPYHIREINAVGLMRRHRLELKAHGYTKLWWHMGVVHMRPNVVLLSD